MSKLRIVQYGCGKMSKYTMRYVYEKGAEIVGAFDINPKVIGMDIGQIMECEDKGVVVSDVRNAKKILKELKPDACIITTCEEAFYPWNSNPVLTKKIDQIAKASGCTIAGSGYQDIYWGQLISSICGSTQSIKKIIGESWYNVEDYGIALAEAHGAGLTLDEFDKKIASVDRMSDEERQKIIDSGTYSPSYMWNVNGWLCDKLGLTVTRQSQECIPETYDKDIESSTLGMTIKAGDATGMSAVVTTETKEGVTLVTKCVGKVYAPDEFDRNEWTVEGEPNTTITVQRPATVELTCASIVNRIPDLIDAKPGFVPTAEMGDLQFKKSI